MRRPEDHRQEGLEARHDRFNKQDQVNEQLRILLRDGDLEKVLKLLESSNASETLFDDPCPEPFNAEKASALVSNQLDGEVRAHVIAMISTYRDWSEGTLQIVESATKKKSQE